jgi:hypothetical protein
MPLLHNYVSFDVIQCANMQSSHQKNLIICLTLQTERQTVWNVHEFTVRKMQRFAHYIITLVASLIPATAFIGCSGSSSSESAVVHDTVYLQIKETPAPANPFDRHLDSMPDAGCVKMKINSLGGTLARVFNDSNYVHLEEAERMGIKPIESLADVWNLRRPIVRIKSCREYGVDSLTHSLPYLVPEAADLLKEIGSRFNDSLQARGGGAYRMKVTSMLRTKSSIKRLRRRNGNAVEASAHQYATTFDISYVNFICDSATVNRTQEDLKNLLGEVLKAVRDEGHCYVKYERHQGCYHITARDYKK